MKDVMHYKGFTGSVRFSAADEVFHGKLEGITDLVTYEGNSVDELKKTFKEAVDDYLELCKDTRKQIEKTFKGGFNVRLEPELHKQAAQLAVMAGMSLNRFVREAIRDKVVHTQKHHSG